mmetsp:Transcript_12702/g.12552  ORF Transcript_12702/g.12552 Transcript_12702/m.12552 type:complete len:203 (-) Transcript_12702:205-813(-)
MVGEEEDAHVGHVGDKVQERDHCNLCVVAADGGGGDALAEGDGQEEDSREGVPGGREEDVHHQEEGVPVPAVVEEVVLEVHDEALEEAQDVDERDEVVQRDHLVEMLHHKEHPHRPNHRVHDPCPTKVTQQRIQLRVQVPEGVLQLNRPCDVHVDVVLPDHVREPRVEASVVGVVFVEEVEQKRVVDVLRVHLVRSAQGVLH